MIRVLRFRSRSVFALALATLLLLSGCVYLRLLELKNQLADFDRFFAVDLHDGVKLTLKKPVLLDEDMAFFKLVPESRERIGTAERWRFRWIKANAGPEEIPENYEVTGDFIFSQHKLSKVILPERLFAFIPKANFIGMLKSVGHAQIDREKRTATSSYNGDIPIAPMTQGQIGTMLGVPYETNETAEGIACRYRYQKATPDQRAGSIDITFLVNPADHRVLRLKGRIFDATIELDFSPTPTPAPLSPTKPG
jgi:hypothetical protein